MNFAPIKEQANTLFANARFLVEITHEADYQQALALMDELIEEYDQYQPVIRLLAASIERWENQAPEFADFNQRIAALDTDIAVLRTLMDQHQLKLDDLKQEIGGKSVVSMILSGQRQLTKKHIQALSNRFNISPALFFEHQRTEQPVLFASS